MTGAKLFLLYAFPCAWSRVVRGKISLEHHDELERLALAPDDPRPWPQIPKRERAGLNPRRDLLKFCFPYAFHRLRDQARLLCYEDPFVIENVRLFWREHHAETDFCRVALVRVLTSDDRSAIYADGTTMSRALNIYQLSLQPGDSAYVHFGVVIEKTET